MSFLQDLFKSAKRPSDQPSPYGDFGTSLKGMLRGYKGLYGTNQNSPGPGGYNYATPQAAASAKAPAPVTQPMGGGGSSFGGGDSFAYGNASGLSDERVAEIGNILASGRTGAARLEPRNTSTYDVDKYFSDVNDPTNPLAGVDLRIARNSLNNRRNDIAVGEVNPYDIADDYGVVFSPDQRRNQQAAAARIYDPMLEDVNARIDYEEEMAKGASKSWSDGVLAGLSNQNADDITSYIRNNYTNLDIVKNLRNEVTAFNKIASIDANTANGPQKQGIISDFAKSLDPDSVVREAEFALAKKYSQSGAEAIKQNIKQWTSGNGQLAPEAIQAIQAAARARLNQTLQQDKYIKDQVIQVLKDTYGDREYERLFVDYSPYNYQDGGSGGETFQDQSGQWYRMDPDGGATPIDPPSFNRVGGGTYSAMKGPANLAEAKSRISGIESGGNYQALGPVVQTGAYKGQRALGKYQVMPGNLPSWSLEAVGRQVTPQEFLSNPQLQEAIVSHRMNEIYKKYRNWTDVASVWFTGKPASQGSQLADVTGTTGAEYVRRFQAG